MALEQGIITRAGEGTAHMRTQRLTACEGCSERHICHSMGGKQEVEIEVANPVQAEPGDTVLVAFKTSQLLLLSFMLYIFPIIAMVAGAVLGNTIVAPNTGGDPSIYAAVFGFLFFAAAMGAIKLKDAQAKRTGQYRPVVVRIKKKAPPDAEAPAARLGCHTCRTG
jgi:sigma-E factor negative regulatory protein RseC